MAVDQVTEHVIRVPSGYPATRLGKYVGFRWESAEYALQIRASSGFVSAIKIVVIVAIEVGVICVAIEVGVVCVVIEQAS